MLKSSHFTEFRIYLFICLLLWIYLWLRAIWVPMAHDEVATFFYYVQTADFLPFIAHEDMNNHVVNSALSTLFYNLLGPSSVVLRLANLLFFPLYCLFVLKFSLLFSSKLIRWWFILVMLMIHGFIEFFALSRGYGISMALFMVVLYYFYRILSCFSLREFYSILCLIILATLANLSLFYLYLLIIGGLLLILIWKSDSDLGLRKFIHIPVFTLVSALFLLVFATILFRGRNLGLLYTGGHDGIISITLGSLLRIFLHSESRLYGYILVCLSFLSFGYALNLFIRRRTLFLPVIAFNFMLAAVVILYWFMDIIFGVNYPEDRTAIYLLPLFCVAVGLSVDDLILRSRNRRWILLLAPVMILPLLFTTFVNFTHSETYLSDTVPDSFYFKVKAAHKEGEYPPTVGGRRGRHFCWSIHDYLNGGTESIIFHANYPNTVADFQIADAKDLGIFAKKYQVIDYCQPSNRYLLKRRSNLLKIPLAGGDGIQFPPEKVEEFVTLCQARVDTLTGRNLYIGFEGDFTSEVAPLQAWITAEVKDSGGKSLEYINLTLNWLRLDWKGPDSYLKSGFILPPLPAGSSEFCLYLWNIQHSPVTIRNFSWKLFRYQAE